MNQYGIALFHPLPEVLAATPIARQLKTTDPGCHVTWFTTAEGALLLAGNPDVDAVVALTGSDAQLAQRIPALREERRWTRFFTPASAVNPEAHPGGCHLEQIRASAGLQWSVPFQARFSLTADEVAAARRYWARLPAGPRILIESGADVGGETSPWSEDFLADLVAALRDLDPVLVLIEPRRPLLLEHLQRMHPRTVWCREPLRLGAELVNLCDAFVGVGGPVSALGFSDWCRAEVPRLEIVRSETFRGTLLDQPTRFLPCATRRRFRQALSTLRAWLQGRPAPALHTTRVALPTLAANDEQPCPHCGQVRFHSARGGGIVTCTMCEQIYTRVCGELTSHPVYRAPNGVSDRRPTVDLGLDPDARTAWRAGLVQTALRAWGGDAHRVAVLLVGDDNEAVRQRLANAGPQLAVAPLRLASRLGEGMAAGSVDVVVAPHAIDRVPDPLDLLDRFAFLLRPGGVLLATVPNLTGLGAVVFPQHWPWLMPERCRLHFRPRQLRDLVYQAGLGALELTTATGEAGLAFALEALCASQPHLAAAHLPSVLERVHALGAGEELAIVARKPGTARAARPAAPHLALART